MQLGLGITRFQPPLNPIVAGLRVLATYGSNAHLWLPGIGQVNGVDIGNYLDSAGTTTALADNPIGLVLDQGHGGGTLGANLVSNPGPFTNTTGYSSSGTLSVSGGQIVSSVIATSYSSIVDFSVPTTPGQNYRVVLTGSASGGTPLLYVGTTVGGGEILGGQTAFSLNFVAQTTTTYFRITNNTNATSYTLASASVRAISGIPASQATAGNRPTLRRGVTNLLTYSNDLTNAVWSKASLPITSSGLSDPAGGTGAFELTGATSDSAFGQSVTPVSGVPYTGAIWLKVPSGTLSVNVYLNGGGILASKSITLTTAWQLVTVTGTTSSTAAMSLQIGGGSTIGVGVKIDAFAGGLFTGTLTASQIQACGGIPLTTSAAASSSAGNWGWGFTAANSQVLVPASPSVQVTQDFALVSGVRYDQGINCASVSVTNGTTNNLVMNALVPAGNTWAYLNAGGTAVGGTDAVNHIGVPIVQTSFKTGSTFSGRLNASQFYSSNTAGIGTGSFTQMNLGAWFMGTGHIQGQVFAVASIASATTIPVADLLAIERMVGALTGPTGVIF